MNLESDTGVEEEVINVRVNLPKSKSESSGNRIEPSKTKNTNTTANQKSARNDKLENNSRAEEKLKKYPHHQIGKAEQEIILLEI